MGGGSLACLRPRRRLARMWPRRRELRSHGKLLQSAPDRQGQPEILGRGHILRHPAAVVSLPLSVVEIAAVGVDGQAIEPGRIRLAVDGVAHAAAECRG